MDFKLPYDDFIAMWRRTFGTAFDPEGVHRRFLYNQERIYPNRIWTPPTYRLSVRNVSKRLTTLAKPIVKVGIFSDYLRAALTEKGQCPSVRGTALVHLPAATAGVGCPRSGLRRITYFPE